MVNLVKTIEDRRALGGRDADAIVANGQFHSAVFAADLEGDVFVGTGVFPGVVEEIIQQANERRCIAGNVRKIRL